MIGQEQMLKEIIEKAVKGGYTQYTPEYLDAVIKNTWPLETLIFSHDFAKAYFGEKKTKWIKVPANGMTIETDINRGWQYHIQQAVISEDPIDYYYKFL